MKIVQFITKFYCVIWLVVAAALVIALIPSPFAYADEDVHNAERAKMEVYDWHGEINSEIEKKEVDSPQEVDRTPLFENFPFLRLKAGDKIVKGHRWHNGLGKTDSGYSKDWKYFVVSQGKYFYLYNTQVDEKSKLFNAWDSLLFDWHFNLQSAAQLYQDFQYELGSPIEPSNFPKLQDALRAYFPETLMNTEKVETHAPHAEGEGQTQRAVFESLRFDDYRDIVYFCRVEVGNGIFTQTTKPLIIGPRHVEREEFEGYEAHGVNSARSHHPDAATAAKARAAYDRMIAFQKIINRFLVKPRIGQSFE